jgi:hypothetical protein
MCETAIAIIERFRREHAPAAQCDAMASTVTPSTSTTMNAGIGGRHGGIAYEALGAVLLLSRSERLLIGRGAAPERMG